MIYMYKCITKLYDGHFEIRGSISINVGERQRQHPTYLESRVGASTFFGYRTPSNFQRFVKEDLVATRRFKFQR